MNRLWGPQIYNLMTHGKCKIIHENDAKILLHISHRNVQHCDIACCEKQLILCKL